jgi:hypothetical protein
MLVDQPTQHIGRAIGAVGHQSGGIEIEAFHRTFDHAPCGKDLGLPDRRGRFNIDDDRVLDIDQIVGGIGEEGLPAMGSSPARRRIGRRDELGCDLARSAEGCVIENCQILLDRTSCRFRRKTFLALAAIIGICLSHTTICI